MFLSQFTGYLSMNLPLSRSLCFQHVRVGRLRAGKSITRKLMKNAYGKPITELVLSPLRGWAFGAEKENIRTGIFQECGDCDN